jgi:TM2 domain-containing membrane protein YozV
VALIACHECGHQVSNLASNCPNCGAPTGTALPTPKSTKSRGLAAFLAFFLGGLGIHKFYLNRPGQAVIYLLFCWTFIPTVVAFFEAIFYCFLSNEEFKQKYQY